MSLPKEFWEQLPAKSDAELYEILANEQDYSPEALAAAKEELGYQALQVVGLAIRSAGQNKSTG